MGNAAVQEMLFGSGGYSSAATHTVKKGETLGTIAKLYSGDPKRYTELWEANQASLPNPNVVTAGQVLILPESWFSTRPAECDQEPTPETTPQTEDDDWSLGGLWDSTTHALSDGWDTATDTASAGVDWMGEQASAGWDWTQEQVSGAWDSATEWWADEDEAEEVQGGDSSQGVKGGAGVDPEADKSSGSGKQDDAFLTMICSDPKAVLRGDDLKPKDPEVLLPKGSYVRIVEEKTEGGKLYVKVAETKTPNGPTGKTLGWTMKSNLKSLGARPARPSDPSAQMSALLTAATTSARPAGYCYRKIKQAIKAAGGYGDILDIYTDERFDGFQGSAVNFPSAIDRLGASAFDLKQVGGLPKDAAPGTLMVIKGNGQQRLSETHGDINVIAGVEGGAAKPEVRLVTSSKALLRDDSLQPIAPEQLIPKDSYVWVLSEKEMDGNTYLQVAEASGQDAEEGGDLLGWTAASNVKAAGGSTALIKCYNDGVMRLPADADTWTSGKYEGVLVGMYQPVARA